MSEDWICVPDGKNKEVQDYCEAAAAKRLETGDYSIDNVKYVEKVRLDIVDGSLNVSDERLEKLRALCQLWNVDIVNREISSHRPVIGKFIVAGKRLIFPILRAFLKDFVRQQRAFNARAVSLIAEIANEDK